MFLLNALFSFIDFGEKKTPHTCMEFDFINESFVPLKRVQCDFFFNTDFADLPPSQI